MGVEVFLVVESRETKADQELMAEMGKLGFNPYLRQVYIHGLFPGDPKTIEWQIRVPAR